ncbi:TonB-dependent receptor [Hymenobacter sp. BT664]|uniref:TonB-dependent receptor n=1 Tax=Hymenobacter montanus TaxID=2771359 RepID=A0A927BD91_9BACT|nr:TonB-dependent receptor [Hymenobacter montanus]MBD2768681.1 TonB-dependent receptor [Hymenobacter montanus]
MKNVSVHLLAFRPGRQLGKMLLSALVGLLPITGLGQNSSGGPVSGRVLDERAAPVPFATVRLLRAADSTVVDGAVSDSAGRYVLPRVGAGRYRLAASQLGYRRGLSPAFEVAAGGFSYDFRLAPDAQALGEVRVLGRRPLVEQRLDGTVLNVENSIVAAGTSVLEVLKRAPDVAVDASGNVSLRGQANVLVLLNGKPTYLGPEQLAHLLRTMPSSQVARVEVLPNPPAQYDAAGSAGVINILTKRPLHGGWNGSLTASYGRSRYPKPTSGGQVSFRRGRWNTWGAYDFAADENTSFGETTRRFQGPTASVLTQESRYQGREGTHTYRVGAEYLLRPATTLGLLLEGVGNTSDYRGRNTADLLPGGAALPAGPPHVLTLDHTSGHWRNHSLNVNLQHAFDTLGRTLSADINAGRYAQANTQVFDTRAFTEQGQAQGAPDFLRIESPGTVDLGSVKLDYAQPLGAATKLEGGAKLSRISLDNDAQFFVGQGPAERRDPGRSNRFTYRETVVAGYTQLRGSRGKTDVQLGLRGEQTDSRGRQLTSDSVVTRRYFQLFPNAALTYTPSKQHRWRVAYSRRIDRPAYSDLNPFVYLQDPFSFDTGNPYLQPQLTHVAELGHDWRGGLLTATVFHRRTSQVQERVPRQNDDTRVTLTRPENLGRRDQTGLTVATSTPLTAWWTLSASGTIAWTRYTGSIEGGALDNARLGTVLNTTQTFTLPRGRSAEVSAQYSSATAAGLGVRRPTGQVAVGVQQTLWAEKATLRLGVQDLFYTSRFGTRTQYQNLDVATAWRRDSRVVTLTASYRFGTRTAAPSRATGLEEEQARQGR